MTDYSMVNRTYRYFAGEPLYPFGYDLSYTSFRFGDLVISPARVKADSNVTLTFSVTNTGALSGDEVC
jgi:beta-glucosidase